MDMNGANESRFGGFSLIELLVVVAIIGVLASIAVPAYNDYLRRAKLVDGTAVLADYRIKLEQYFQDNRDYGTAGAACGVAVPAGSSLFFNYACVVGAAPGDTYVATATSVAGGGMGASGAFVYTLNEQNARATTSYKGTGVTKTCWLISGSEC